MGKLWAFVSTALSGGLDSADLKRFAARDCVMCRGSGVRDQGLDRVETCSCVYRSMRIEGEIHQRQMVEERERLEGMQRYIATETDEDKRRRILGLDEEGWGIPAVLSDDQLEQQRIEGKLRFLVTPSQKQAMDAGKLSTCCASKRCHCGVNHWSQVPGQPAPPTEEPARSTWLAWRAHIDASPMPPRPGVYVPPWPGGAPPQSGDS